MVEVMNEEAFELLRLCEQAGDAMDDLNFGQARNLVEEIRYQVAEMFGVEDSNAPIFKVSTH